MTAVHVVPTDDITKHDTYRDCICGPTLEAHRGGWLYIHHSLDGREAGE